MKKLLVLLLLLIPSEVFASSLTLNQISEASCRVNVGNAYGSGTAIHDDGESIFVLTNAHVVGSGKQARVEFFKFGRISTPIIGSVIFKAYKESTNLDFALIKIPKSLFGQYPPRVVSMAPPGTTVKSGHPIQSGGCPEARWLELWEGHILDDPKLNVYYFKPPPLGGQSGSGVYATIDDTTYLIGVVTWRLGSGQSAYGGAIPINIFQSALKGQVSYNLIPEYFRQADYKVFYARASDGKYYKQNEDGSVNVPTGTVIVEWNCPPPSSPNRPSPNIPYQQNPNNPSTPNNPYALPDGLTNPPSGGSGGGGSQLQPSPPLVPIPDSTELAELKKRYETLDKEHKLCKDKYDELLKQKQELENALNKCKEDSNALRKSIENLTTIANSSKVEKEKISEQITIIQSQIVEKEKTISELQKKIEIKESQINNSVIEQNIAKGALTKVKNDLDIAIKAAKYVLFQRNILFSILAIVGGITSIYFMRILIMHLIAKWKEKRTKEDEMFFNTKKSILNRLDSIESKLNNKDCKDNVKPPTNTHSKVGDCHYGSIEEMEKDQNFSFNQSNTFNSALLKKLELIERKLSQHDSNVAAFKDYIDDRVNILSRSKLEPMIEDNITNIENKVENIIKNQKITNSVEIENKIDSGVDNNGGSVDSGSNDNDEDEGFQFEDSCNTPINERIKQFFDLKAKSGESIEQWAFYALLYREAMKLLRKGRFTVENAGKINALQGQKITARKIDEWVRQEYLKRMTLKTLSKDTLYHYAMIGFLYKEAVELLRQGFFPVLGYRETAEAIENWVRVEFMKRMGLT